MKDAVTVAIFLVVLGLAFFAGLSPAILIVCAGVVGYVTRRLLKLGKEAEGK